MSRDLEHQSLESTFSKVAELEFVDDEDDIRDSAFPNGEDAYDDESDSSDSSSEGSVDLGLADDLRESDSAMQCVLEMDSLFLRNGLKLQVFVDVFKSHLVSKLVAITKSCRQSLCSFCLQSG